MFLTKAGSGAGRARSPIGHTGGAVDGGRGEKS